MTPAGRDAGPPRDWNAVLNRVLEPFRTEAAAFRVLLWVAAVFAVVIAVVLVVRAL
ncbi:hypothetical protein [Baekduia soli]|uniref:hypothetical protein n=1 Tax=Baekduia soli TaxID=496014 RepID=UPI0016528539|nr:hypothetical protein [Baekduia soli]